MAHFMSGTARWYKPYYRVLPSAAAYTASAIVVRSGTSDVVNTWPVLPEIIRTVASAQIQTMRNGTYKTIEICCSTRVNIKILLPTHAVQMDVNVVFHYQHASRKKCAVRNIDVCPKMLDDYIMLFLVLL